MSIGMRLRSKFLFASTATTANPGSRPKSHRFSQIVRKLVEKYSLHTFIGIILTLFAGGLAFASPASVRSDYDLPVLEVITLSPAATQLTTQHSIRGPLGSSELKVNQRFYSYHPGIDLKGQSGDPIYPIMKGQVVGVHYWRYAYGNHILVDHGQGIQSLYAHLSKINVTEGQTVETNSTIGLIGTTGHSTGPHLHLEVIDQGKHINPLSLLQSN